VEKISATGRAEMNELVTMENKQTMTSLEIAELVEKRHDNVKRTIETLVNGSVIGFPQSEENPTNGLGGRPGTHYLVDKRSSYIIVAQLSPEFTARLVDRWQKLEEAVLQQVQLPDFTNPAIAARAWADEVEQKQQLQIQLEKNAPKVQLATAIEGSPKSIKIGDYVKAISKSTGFIIGRNNFFKWLKFEQIVDGRCVPYQRYIDNKWFEVKESTYEHQNTNGPQTCFTTLITGRGQVSVLNRFKKSEHFQMFLNKKAGPTA
jgi:anti-repressor protein